MNRAIGAWRDSLAKPACAVCSREDTLVVHHVAKGPCRKHVPENLVLLCGTHHDQTHRDVNITIIHEYAIKAIGDAEHYDRVALNVLRGRAAEAVSEVEVIAAAFELPRFF